MATALPALFRGRAGGPAGCPWPLGRGASEAAELVETAHAELLSEFSGAEIVGFHGQTLAHEPGGRGTHQAGDGSILAEVLELPVIWDFPQQRCGTGRAGRAAGAVLSFRLRQMDWRG